MKYGFPLDYPYANKIYLRNGKSNHASANDFPDHGDLDTQLNHLAKAGPLKNSITAFASLNIYMGTVYKL